MKSSNPSISPKRFAMLATAVVLSSGIGLHAQSSSTRASSTNASNTAGSNTSNYNDTGRSNSMAGSLNTNASDDTSSARMSNDNASSSSNKLSWGDRRFVTKAADGGQEEVKVAQLATQKANNPDVRSFAQQLVQDHTQVNTELMSMAMQKNVKVDNDDNESRVQRRLAKASGQDFDREFIEQMVDDHEKDIKMFEKAAKDAKDMDVRQFASKHVDHLRQHLAQAQQLQRSIVPTGRTNDDSSWRGANAPSNTSGSSADRSSSNAGGSGDSPSATGRSSNASSSEASSGSSMGASSSSTSSIH